MRKGGIIAAIIIILILSLILFGIGLIKEDIPIPKFGKLNNIKVNNKFSNENFTIITGKFNITNTAKKFLEINLLYNNSKCDISYYKQHIGEIFINFEPYDFINLTKYNLKKGTNNYGKDTKSIIENIDFSNNKIYSTISSGKNKTVYVLFKLSNKNLSKALYNHTIKNYERGNIWFKLNFSFNISILNISTINLENITLEFEKDFFTNILGELNWLKYNASFSSNISNDRIIFNRTISILKDSESNIINFDIIKGLFHRTKVLCDLYIGESSYWIKNSDSNNIRIGQELIFYGKPWKLKLLDLLFPIKFDLNANNKPIGDCIIDSIERTNRFSNERRAELDATIYNAMIGELIYEHINHNNSTSFKISNINVNNKLCNFLLGYFSMNNTDNSDPIYFNISDIITEINLEDVSIDLTEIEQFLLLLQILTSVIIINTVILLIVFYFAFWRKGKYLIFKK